MIKALFFDVDGTLVGFRQTQLSDRLRADLLALQAKKNQGFYQFRPGPAGFCPY